MTRIKVTSGACGFSVTITAEQGEDKKVGISLDTECEMVKKMIEDVSILDMRAAFTGFMNNPVYKSASKHIRHVACPVPGGILKALEVESGVNLPKDVTIIFEREET